MHSLAPSGRFSGDTLEAIVDGHDGRIDRVQQLSPGDLDFRMAWANLPGVVVTFFRYGAALRFETERIERGFVFNAVLKADEFPRFRGAEVRDDHAHVQPVGESLDYVTFGDTEVLVIEVEPDLANANGWSREMPPLFRTSKAALRALARTCREVVDASAAWKTRPPQPAESEGIRDRIVAELKRVLRPILHTNVDPSPLATRYRGEYALIRRAEAWNESGEREGKSSVTEMADALHVSVSTLHRAFHAWAGISPRRFFALKRLHQFRRNLFLYGNGSGAVTRAAMETGFDHLGRLAGDYKKLFGESPSESLKRWEA